MFSSQQTSNLVKNLVSCWAPKANSEIQGLFSMGDKCAQKSFISILQLSYSLTAPRLRLKGGREKRYLIPRKFSDTKYTHIVLPSVLQASIAMPRFLDWISPRYTGTVGFWPMKHETISVPPGERYKDKQLFMKVVTVNVSKGFCCLSIISRFLFSVYFETFFMCFLIKHICFVVFLIQERQILANIFLCVCWHFCGTSCFLIFPILAKQGLQCHRIAQGNSGSIPLISLDKNQPFMLLEMKNCNELLYTRFGNEIFQHLKTFQGPCAICMRFLHHSFHLHMTFGHIFQIQIFSFCKLQLVHHKTLFIC